MNNKPYFTKYLPVEGESNEWQWNNNIQNTGWESISPSDMDVIIAHGLQPAPEFRKVKLFLCSIDIQVGDSVLDTIENTISIIDTEDQLAYFKAILSGDNTGHPRIKVIGEISPDALSYVKKDDEFDENQVELFWQIGEESPYNHLRYKGNEYLENELDSDGGKWRKIFKIIARIKGPCDHFH